MALPEEPYTRVERYLARLSGQDVDIPDYPITRIECYLDYLCGNGGVVPAPNAGAHNGVFRGQSLGTSFTSAQSQAIASGSFEGLFVGDYWTISDVVYRIAGFDLYYNVGDPAFEAHHAVIVPDTTLYAAPMNATNTTEGGYASCALKASGLDDALATVKAAFGEAHILTRSTRLCNAVSSGSPSGAVWVNSQIDLMCEGQVLGRGAWGSVPQNGVNVNEKYAQMPLFSLAPQYAVTRGASYWLQDVRSSSNFALMHSAGNCYHGAANADYGVRPYFCIGLTGGDNHVRRAATGQPVGASADQQIS